MANALEVLKKQGAVLVDINDAAFDTGKLASDLDVQKYEYKFELNQLPQGPTQSSGALACRAHRHGQLSQAFAGEVPGFG